MNDAQLKEIRWFKRNAAHRCQCGCGRIATGEMMGSRNQSMGYFREPCANKLLRDAEKKFTLKERGFPGT